MRALKVAVLLISPSVLVGVAYGSPITWNTPSQISAPTDVETNGAVLAAYAFQPIGGAVTTTINGVLFSNFDANNALTDTTGDITLSTAGSGGIAGGGAGIFSSTNPPYSTLASAYTAMLGSGDYVVNSPMTVTIAGLSIGTVYEVEFWVNDSRGTLGPLRTDILDGNTTVHFNTGVDGGLGQFVTGTFTATAATQAFTVQGATTATNYASQINGIEVSSIPEPSTLAMMGMGALALGLARFRRR